MPDSQQSSSGTQGLRRLYRVLEHYEQEKTSFSLEELAEACGYRLSTIRTRSLMPSAGSTGTW